MNEFIELLNSEINDISSKKFNSKIASTNFCDFQKELSSCLFSDFVIEINDDDSVEGDCAELERTAPHELREETVDEDHQQILRFIKSQLDEFAAKYDQLILDSASRGLSDGLNNLPPGDKGLEADIGQLLPPLSSVPETQHSKNLELWSEIIENEVAHSLHMPAAQKSTV
eukprot:Gregarina_sp_Pseudo_9__5470@NODE_694_length_2355_cov_56_609240_g656_i0_p2_GENE_NODE_694_length_2355_cov_56_609240_g656_i0NODE_694_length_2355_cov_56_609240_g656_i0_p2_ORF_typecomplete_len171_score47_77_NODE_694_length_2355_cov_56_609240_g656_i0220732